MPDHTHARNPTKTKKKKESRAAYKKCGVLTTGFRDDEIAASHDI